jgi:hypothetical protein
MHDRPISGAERLRGSYFLPGLADAHAHPSVGAPRSDNGRGPEPAADPDNWATARDGLTRHAFCNRLENIDYS